MHWTHWASDERRFDRRTSIYVTRFDNIARSLPPANEVWGKVIFSEACVKNSVHMGGGCLVPGDGVPVSGRVPGPRGMSAPGGGVCSHEGAWSRGGVCSRVWSGGDAPNGYWNAFSFFIDLGCPSN